MESRMELVHSFTLAILGVYLEIYRLCGATQATTYLPGCFFLHIVLPLLGEL